jgi:putative flavoprotein involved in K+ transport
MSEARPRSADPVERHEAVVIGAGPAGLAAAAMLGKKGVETVVLDRAPQVGASWRGHYDRLHLHTIRWLSNLPGMPISRTEGPWVSREGVVRYLESYARDFDLHIRAGVDARSIKRAGDEWSVDTSGGAIRARWVVVATGFNSRPHLPDWNGQDSFQGELVHSSEYRNPQPYREKSVLVVGTGNSGAEICVDLVEGGAAAVSLSVRTPPNILRRDVAGFPNAGARRGHAQASRSTGGPADRGHAANHRWGSLEARPPTSSAGDVQQGGPGRPDPDPGRRAHRPAQGRDGQGRRPGRRVRRSRGSP